MNSERSIDTALMIIRLTLGGIMAAHGAQKVLGVFGGSGIEPFAGMIKAMGFTPPLVWAWAAALSELAGGILLALGIIPRFSAAMIGIVMAVAIIKVHGANGFFMMKGGYEYQLLILASCVALVISGAGKYSLFNKF